MSSIKELIKGFSPKGIAEGALGTVLEKGADIADRFIVTGEEKQKFAVEWAKLQADIDKQYLADKQSAREMQMAALKQDDKFAKRFVYYLALVTIGGALTFGCGLFFIEIPEKNDHLVQMFADVFLFSSAITIYQFFFGSSKTEKDIEDREISSKIRDRAS